MRTTTRSSSSSSTGKGSEQSHFKGRLQGWKHKSCNNTDSVLHNDYHEALLTTTQCGRLGVVANGSLFLLMRWHRWGCPCLSACLNRWMNERLPTHIIRTDYVIIPSAIQFPFTTIAHILFSDQSCSTNLHRTTYNGGRREEEEWIRGQRHILERVWGVTGFKGGLRKLTKSNELIIPFTELCGLY